MESKRQIRMQTTGMHVVLLIDAYGELVAEFLDDLP